MCEDETMSQRDSGNGSGEGQVPDLTLRTLREIRDTLKASRPGA